VGQSQTQDHGSQQQITFVGSGRTPKMVGKNERRREHRLEYYWPIWFTQDFCETLSQGKILDISSTGAAFASYIDDSCPYRGQGITAHFSVPRFGSDESFEMANFTRSGRICRVHKVHKFIHRVALQFAEPLPFKPGEQVIAGIKFDQHKKHNMVMA
jgi:hypothetical protein